MNDKYRVFKSIISHKVLISGDETSLFNESNKNDSSITNLTEQEMVKWLFNNDGVNQIISEDLCNADAEDIYFALEVSEPLLNKEDQKIIGDIDAILIPKNNPEKSVIIEFKRIKINTSINQIVKANKIQTTKNKGFSQIKKLRKFNYYKTYLGVIIEDDARNVNSANTIIRDSEGSDVDSIYNINKESELEKDAGLFFIKIVQPTGENFGVRYNFGLFIEKKASEIVQSELASSRVHELLKNRNN